MDPHFKLAASGEERYTYPFPSVDDDPADPSASIAQGAEVTLNCSLTGAGFTNPTEATRPATPSTNDPLQWATPSGSVWHRF